MNLSFIKLFTGTDRASPPAFDIGVETGEKNMATVLDDVNEHHFEATFTKWLSCLLSVIPIGIIAIYEFTNIY